MPQRQFASATSDYIGLNTGAFVFTGAVSFLAVIAKTRDGDNWDPLIGGEATAGAFRWAFGFNAIGGQTNKIQLRTDPQTADHSTTTVTVADGWVVIGVSKATGSSTPRYHIKKGGVWTHEAGVIAVPGPSVAPSWNTLRLGYDQNDPTAMKMGFIAAWDSELSDANFESMTSVQTALDLTPQGAWLLDQSDVATSVDDLASGGQTQSARSGTSVITETVTVFDLSRPSTGPVPLLHIGGRGAGW